MFLLVFAGTSCSTVLVSTYELLCRATETSQRLHQRKCRNDSTCSWTIPTPRSSRTEAMSFLCRSSWGASNARSRWHFSSHSLYLDSSYHGLFDRMIASPRILMMAASMPDISAEQMELKHSEAITNFLWLT